MDTAQELFRILDNHYDDEELKTLCFKLKKFAPDLQYANLGGDGKAAKARELITYMERRDLLRELALAIKAERPEVTVPIPEPTKPAPPSSAQKLNRLALWAWVGALVLLAVAVVVVLSRREGTSALPPATTTDGLIRAEYHVALTVSEECPAEWEETLATRIKENVDTATPARPVAYGALEEADLVLDLVCTGEAVVWTAQWTDSAPIFDIVGSPAEVEITMPLNLADSELFGRALIHYGQNNYNSARNALTQLANRSEATALQLLYANTLLLTEEYTPTVDAYTKIIDTANGDELALAYNNRGLAHLDEYYRLEKTQIPEEEQRAALGDLAQAQVQLTADSAPEVRALVNSNVGIAELLLMFPDDDMNAIVHRADEACRAAEAADPGSAWMRICRAAIIIDPRKFDLPPPCEPDLYASAEQWLAEAQEQEPDLAAVYYWRALLLLLNVHGCQIVPTGEIDFMAQCVEWKQRLIALRKGGWAPLVLHAYLEEFFTRCSAFVPEVGSAPREHIVRQLGRRSFSNQNGLYAPVGYSPSFLWSPPVKGTHWA